ncbi:MAG: secretin N-terminal domain-containing protein, partial [Desulfobia sp.]
MTHLAPIFKQTNILSGLKIASILAVVLLFSACAHLESDVEDKAPAPVNFQDIERSERDGDKSDRDGPQAGDEGKNATAVLEQVEAQNRQFNERINSIMSESGPERLEPETKQKDDKEPASGKKEVSFNFYDADLVEVVRVFMDLIDDDYVFHPDISGRVSLSVDDEFTDEQLVDLLQGVLRINNMTMMENQKGVWEIMPMSEASSQSSSERIFLDPNKEGQKRGQIIQVIKLRYIAATELIKIIKPYLSQNAAIYAHDARGVLLICDYPHVLDKVDQLAGMFDESVFGDVLAKVYTLKYAQADEAVEELQKVARKFGLSKDQGGPNRRVGFVPLARTNTVVAVTRDEQVMEFVDAWVDELDKKVPSALSGQEGSDIFVYYVQFGDADNIVES